MPSAPPDVAAELARLAPEIKALREQLGAAHQTSAAHTRPAMKTRRRRYGACESALVEMEESRTPRPERSAGDHYERVR